MLTLIIALILGSGVLLGYGCAIAQMLFKNSSFKTISGGLGSWMLLGLMGVGWLGLMLNFFFPLSSYCSLVLFGVGWGLLIKSSSLLNNIVKRSDVGLWFCSISVSSLIAIASFYNTDTGYYHLPSVTLSRTFPLLPGVANVFGPYGHVSTWFLIEGLWALPGIEETSIFSLNALLLISFFMFLGDWVKEKRSHGSKVFILLLLFGFNHFALGVGGLTPDFPASILSFIVWILFLESMVAKTNPRNSDLSLAFLFSLFAITIKSSTLILFFPLVGIFFWHFKKVEAQVTLKSCLTGPSVRRTVVFGVSLIVLWLVRNIISSGCFLFPQSRTCVESLPWAMPLEQVSFWMSDVKYHLCGVRTEGNVFSNSECFNTWLINFRKEPLIKGMGWALGFGIFMLALVGIKHPLQKATELNKRNLFGALIVILAASAVWLLTAPNLRFALWIPFALLGLFYGVISEKGKWQIPFNRKIFYLGIAWACLVTLRSALLTRPLAVDWSHWPTLPRRGSAVISKVHDFSIVSPLNDFRCWDSSPPCTPEQPKIEIYSSQLGRIWFSPSEKKGKNDYENPYRG